MMTMRFGLGYDSHTFGADRPLRLGGVEIPNSKGLTGHSDGDALAHAVIDALLGATALGDIGQLFPDDDPQWEGADSMVLLADVRNRVTASGYAVVNIDATIITEAPRLAPYTAVMRDCLAEVLEVPVSAISVKAKTNEKMDAVGRGEGLQVFAIASVRATGTAR